MYEYSAEVVKHVDGDTIRLRVDVGFNMTFQDNFRLFGIDTPELRAKDPDEKKRAQLAKLRLAELCPIGSFVRVRTHKADKYGRWLAEIYVNGEDPGFFLSVNEKLVDEGHAKAYHGGKR